MGLDFKLVLIAVPPPPTAATVQDPSPSWRRIGADERYPVFSAGEEAWLLAVGDQVSKGAVFDVGEPCFVEAQGALAGVVQSLGGDGIAFGKPQDPLDPS